MLARIEEASSFLRDELGVNATVSLASVMRELNRNFTGNDRLPTDPDAVAQLLLFAEGSPDRIVSQLADPGFSETRLRGSMPDVGAKRVVALQRRFQAYAAQRFQGTGVVVRMTGEAPVAYLGMNNLSQELMHSALGALMLVTLAIGVAFRSVKVALASVLPNALPVLIALGFYALTGRDVDPLPGVVFCIGIGIAVDDTIHVLARYREELRLGKSRQAAMAQTMAEMVGALSISTVTIAAGFLILCFSDFNMNHTMGWLGALVLALAWLFEVVCTPAAFVVFRWNVGGEHVSAHGDPGLAQQPIDGGMRS